MKDKKRIERHYLDEARRASSIFPIGDPVPNEPLDFLFRRPGGDLGIEITELCREGERGEGARLGYVAPKAKLLYAQKPNAVPVNVSPVFSQDAVGMKPNDLA